MTESQWRTRWRRWLGAKTRINESEWTVLLKSNWMGWASRITGRHLKQNEWTRENVRSLYLEAINKASEIDLDRLDSIFCEDQFNRRHKR